MNLDGPLIDALLEHGITDKQLTLLKNLDAVEYLLETLHDTYECIGCGADNLYGRRDAHTRDCKVMLSRVAIGQHTIEAELEAAENEARRENERRSSPLMSLLRGIAVQSSPLVREGQALMFRAEDWAKAGPAAIVHQSGGANGAALCGAALDNNPGSTVTCPDCLQRLYGPGTVGR